MRINGSTAPDADFLRPTSVQNPVRLASICGDQLSFTWKMGLGYDRGCGVERLDVSSSRREAVLSETSSVPVDTSRGKYACLIPVILGLLGLVSLAIDVPIASFFKEKIVSDAVDHQVRDALEICETFGHGFGATLIIVAVAILAPQFRWDLPWVVSGSLGAGMVANFVKLAIRRTRPVNFDLTVGSVWKTFDREFSGGAGMQSFPSSHTATAFGLAVMLTALFPRGKWYFLLLALLVATQRVVSLAHFPSDVCGGAVVGWLVGSVCANWMTSSRNLFPSEQNTPETA